MPGLVPGIHASPKPPMHVDGRVKPGHDELRETRATLAARIHLTNNSARRACGRCGWDRRE
uniref:Uncharacterized protein n=1 Tax=Bradyrhizobium amphicarpaeae TaxID=1404768 RepID=A0A2U8Q015_9BRAD|nr:hypothetical protein CIT40_26385 [Bradyrhizobium amphicarpaeae]